MFRALLLDKEPQFNAAVQQVDESRLPDGDVHVRVAYSTLNYKDGLAITNKSPVVRVWPMVAVCSAITAAAGASLAPLMVMVSLAVVV